MTVNCVKISQKSLSWTKEIDLSKKEKQRRIQELVDAILSIAKENACTVHLGKPEEIYRFSPKIGGKRLAFQWECVYECGEVCCGTLRSTDKTYTVSGKYAQQIHTRIIGTPQSRKEESLDPDFLYPLLNGNRFEWIRLNKAPNLSINDFTNWERQKRIYRRSIYPFCLAYLSQLVPSQARILELCGGDGECANLLMQQESAKVSRYILVDLNQEELKRAAERLATHIEQKRLTIQNGDVTKLDYKKLCDNEQVDLILAIGALTEQVMPSREAALTALSKSVENLKEGGYVLLTGLTSSWITSDDLEALGLEVLNCISPSRVSCADLDQEFYVARKSSAKKRLWNFPSYPIELRKAPIKLWSGH